MVILHITMSESVESETIQSKIMGKVKWFNNKAGYGFITVCDDGDYKNNDIFTHYSAICVTNSQYKYLVQGEYVEFDLVKSAGGDHEYKAISVIGIRGGDLMCETRATSRPNAEDDGFTPVRSRKNRSARADETE